MADEQRKDSTLEDALIFMANRCDGAIASMDRESIRIMPSLERRWPRK